VQWYSKALLVFQGNFLWNKCKIYDDEELSLILTGAHVSYSTYIKKKKV